MFVELSQEELKVLIWYMYTTKASGILDKDTEYEYRNILNKLINQHSGLIDLDRREAEVICDFCGSYLELGWAQAHDCEREILSILEEISPLVGG